MCAADKVICVICNSRPRRDDRDDEREVGARTCWRLTSIAREKDQQRRSGSATKRMQRRESVGKRMAKNAQFDRAE